MTPSRKLRCAVLGVGHMGQFHAEKFARLKEVELVGICDVQVKRAKQIAEQFKTSAFTHYEALFDKVDAISIAVPTKFHYALARPFLEKGIHVLLEKPIATTLREANHLISLARKNQCILHIGHIEHFNAVWEAARPFIKDPLFLEAHRLSPFKPRNIDVDVILDLMIHDIELIQRIVPSKIRSLSAMGAPILTSKTDIAEVRLQFQNGSVANLTASRVSMKSERILRIFQKEKYIHINFSTGQILICQKSKKKNPPLEQMIIQAPPQDALALEIQTFVETILYDKSRGAIAGSEGRDALALALRVQESVRRSTLPPRSRRTLDIER